MANAIVGTTQQFTTPYLTLDEFKNAPTSLDWSSIVSGGSQAAQDAELTNVIYRASSYIDQFCSQTLGARTNQEQQRVRFSSDGTLRIHPQYHPIVALTALSFGPTPNNLTSVPDCSKAWLEDQSIIYPIQGASLAYSSQGPLSFGYTGSTEPVYATYTYVSGFPSDIFASAALAGATQIIVDDASGIIAGQDLRIYDSANTENVVVANSYVFGSTTVPLVNPLVYAHAKGTAVSALPAAIKEAAILLASAYLKMRGDTSLVLSVTNMPDQQIPGTNSQIGSLVSAAQDLLRPFRRMR